ncbi:hypothetical protein AWB69_09129 [Caballeronia udeis]|uniref:Uncharacterized protein n=1 Tax=Caballeronia udeis TaxID=1232866 RepID=A0A158JZ04_9BURK|nr:hypothetical protein AWB69_09129 [Caballeronia udeis]
MSKSPVAERLQSCYSVFSCASLALIVAMAAFQVFSSTHTAFGLLIRSGAFLQEGPANLYLVPLKTGSLRPAGSELEASPPVCRAQRSEQIHAPLIRFPDVATDSLGDGLGSRSTFQVAGARLGIGERSVDGLLDRLTRRGESFSTRLQTQVIQQSGG